MNHQLRLLDLFSGAGGAAMGYHRAGFEVVGVDIAPQPHYPFTFVQADALEYLTAHGQEYDVIHASPECQGYSPITPRATKHTYTKLVAYFRDALATLGKPFVIENVAGARKEMRHPLRLCGSMFGLETSCGAQLRRHRYFESNILLMSPGTCQHGERTLAVNGHEFRNEASRWAERRTIMVVGAAPREPSLEARKYKTISVTGSTPQQNVERNRIRETFSIKQARIAMGIDWMVMRELSQAIPPAYTEWIGHQLMQVFP